MPSYMLVSRVSALVLNVVSAFVIARVIDHNYPNSKVFMGKSTHAQTVITRPLIEGCGLEARLVTY